MIIEPQVIYLDGQERRVLVHTELMWICGGVIGSNSIDRFTIEASPWIANQPIYAHQDLRWGFGATSYAEMLAEIVVRGYEFPVQEI